MEKSQAIASAAVREGAIQPFSNILQTALERTPGSLLSVNLTKLPSQTWVYSLVILRDSGIYSHVKVDAKENRIIEVK